MCLVKSASPVTRMLGNGRCGYHAGSFCMNDGAGWPVVVVVVVVGGDGGGGGGGGGGGASIAVLVVYRGGCRTTWAPRDLGQNWGLHKVTCDGDADMAKELPFSLRHTCF
ncbi:hypothetical protein BBO_03749 [Beauveria brongniartii RCEF 3172]|uniref:Uncharacterized protein n=1 Tax=Beauveria brongniartii RCEF 3172 TaxID=1081107 RepID=A0A167FET9_9HYPO|nr:hypothetical protein BBO_03749 [Beauveria brongniartii RCEF 3172]